MVISELGGGRDASPDSTASYGILLPAPWFHNQIQRYERVLVGLLSVDVPEIIFAIGPFVYGSYSLYIIGTAGQLVHSLGKCSSKTGQRQTDWF